MLLISSIVLVRYLSKSEYGTFLQAMLIVNTAIPLILFGFPQSIYYFYPLAHNSRGLLARTVGVSLCLSVVAGLGIFLLRENLSHWLNNPNLLKYVILMSLIIFFRGSSLFREPILISCGRLILNSVLTLTCNLVIYISLITGVFLSVSLGGLLTIMTISTAFEFFVYLLSTSNVLIKDTPNNNTADSGTSKLNKVSLLDQFRYSFPIGASGYLGAIGKQMDQYLVSIFFMPSDFAVYSRGAIRLPALDTIQLTLNNIMMPHFVKAYASGDIPTFLKDYHRCIEKIAKVKYPIFAFLFATSPMWITLFFTTEYIGAATIFRVYLISLLIGVTTYGAIPRITGNTGCIFHGMIIAVASNLILSLILISILGPLGAALGTIISSTMTATYLLYRSSIMLSLHIKNLFPWSFLGSLLKVSLLSSIPVYVLAFFWGPEGPLNLLGFLAVSGLLYVYICLFLMMKYKLISIDDMETLSGWLRIDLKVWLPKVTFCRYFDQK